jgi:hypothetical protein
MILNLLYRMILVEMQQLLISVAHYFRSDVHWTDWSWCCSAGVTQNIHLSEK